MRQLTGIIGSGNVGIDPFHPHSWSGISRRFFSECQRRGMLNRAFGVEVSFPVKSWYALKNYSPDRRRWTSQYYSDPGYRTALTRLIGRQLRESDYDSDFFQLGAMYDVPSLARGRTSCYSYNDGNFSMSCRSPHFPKGITASAVDRTLRFEREVNSGLDLIFTMSEYLRRSFISDYGMEPGKVITLGAGINIDELPIPVPDKDYSNGSLLFIGVDFVRKGGLDLVNAFRIVREKVPHATLHIVGPRERITAVPELPGIVWHGFFDKNVPEHMVKLRRLLDDASLFVMPSLYEPFGIAPLEAMAHEIPCVVSNAWALPEIVPDDVCGRLVQPGKWEELADVTIELLKDPSLLERFGKSGRKHVEQFYTWEKVVDRLQDVLG